MQKHKSHDCRLEAHAIIRGKKREPRVNFPHNTPNNFFTFFAEFPQALIANFVFFILETLIIFLRCENLSLIMKLKITVKVNILVYNYYI